MKTNLYRVISVITLIFGTTVSALAQFAGGSGTQADPYQIANVHQLQTIKNHMDKHYVQVADIDATETQSWNDGKGFDPIGEEWIVFRGGYNGSGFKISNIVINRPDRDFVGLFGHSIGADIRNIVIVSNRVSGGNNTGSLVGQAVNSTITSIEIEGNVEGNTQVGGFSGMIINTSVVSSSFNGSVTGMSSVGGLVGFLSVSSIDYSQVNVVIEGKENSSRSSLGGLVGHSDGGIVQNSTAKVILTGTYNLGGIAGVSSGNIINCSADVEIVGDQNVGGIVGLLSGNVARAISLGKINSISASGGIIGMFYRGTLSESAAEMTLIQSDIGIEFGGAVGATDSGEIQDLYLNIIFENTNNVGGVVGRAGMHSTFQRIVGRINVKDTNINGLFASINGANVSNVYIVTEHINNPISTNGYTHGVQIIQSPLGADINTLTLFPDLEHSSLWGILPNATPILLFYNPYTTILQNINDKTVSIGNLLPIEVVLKNSGGLLDTLWVKLQSESDVTIDSTLISLPSGAEISVELFWDTEGELEGIHNLKVSAGFFEEEFQVQLVTVPGETILQSPNSSSINISILPKYEWKRAILADIYTFQLSTNSDFTSIIVNQDNILDTTYIPSESLHYLTTYYWRVKGINQAGDGAWSTPSTFTTIIERPARTLLVSPADSTNDIPVNSHLTWSASNRAEFYRLWLAKDPEFSLIVLDTTGINGLTLDLNDLEYNQMYYWKVAALNVGGVGDTSDVWSFFTEYAYEKPLLDSPALCSEKLELPVWFVWNPVDGAVSYQLEIASDSLFSNLIDMDVASKRISEIETATWQIAQRVSNLNHGSSYYWRVKAMGPKGTSEWSETRKFTTKPAVPGSVVALSLPANGATQLRIPVELSWQPYQGALAYDIQVGLDPDFQSAFNVTAHSTTSLPVSDVLTYAKTYYWRVKARLADQTTDWSESFSFSTRPAEPGTIVQLSAPQNAASGLRIPVQLSWNSYSNAVSYDIQVGTSATFDTVFTVAKRTGTSVEVGDFLLHSRAYHWRVKANLADQSTGWSEVFSFSTRDAVPGSVVALSLPANGATQLRIPVELSWQPYQGALAYDIQVGLDANFQAKVVFSNVTATHNLVSTFVTDTTTYYWSVRAVLSDQISNWSAVRTFRTELRVPEIPNWAPVSGSVNVSINPLLSWTTAQRAESYHVQVSTSANFETLYLDREGIEDTKLQLHALDGATIYYWRIQGVNTSGQSGWSRISSFTTEQTTSIDSETARRYELSQNYPNPFNPSTLIAFTIPESGNVKLTVFSTLGHEIATLVNNHLPVGDHRIAFDASRLSSGIYMYRLEFEGQVLVRRMVLIK